VQLWNKGGYTQKPDKIFMGNPSQDYGVSPKYGVTQFYVQPDINEHTRLSPSQ